MGDMIFPTWQTPLGNIPNKTQSNHPLIYIVAPFLENSIYIINTVLKLLSVYMN